MSLWRLQVVPISGASSFYLDHTNAIEGLPSFSVDPMGGGLEATFTGVGSELGIKPMDGVRIFTRETTGSAWVQRYVGRAVLVPSPHDVDVGQYRLVGVKESLYFMTVTAHVIDGGDVGLMARAARNGTPGAPSYVNADIPELNLQLGDRFPQYESLGELLDELARMCGAFIVPSGSSYSYDGTSYTAGEVVPAVVWGVRDLTSGLYFRRPEATSVSLGESTPGVVVGWEAVNAGEVVDKVRLVYASQYAIDDLLGPVEQYSGFSQLPLQPVARPLHQVHEMPGSPYGRELVVPVEGPRDWLTTTGFTIVSTAGGTQNPENAIDEDPDTYADVSGDDLGTLMLGASLTPEQNGALLYVDMQVGDVNLYSRGYSILISVNLMQEGEPGMAYVNMRYGPRTADQPVRVRRVIPVLVPVDAIDVTTYDYLRVLLKFAIGCRIYDVRAFVPHDDTTASPARTLARSFMREPTQDAASVERIGAHSPVGKVQLTPVVGSVMTLPVERMEYSITRERGVITRYHIGQSFDGDLMAQRAALEALSAAKSRSEVLRNEAKTYEPRRVS